MKQIIQMNHSCIVCAYTPSIALIICFSFRWSVGTEMNVFSQEIFTFQWRGFIKAEGLKNLVFLFCTVMILIKVIEKLTDKY